jgi:hypothetical protein
MSVGYSIARVYMQRDNTPPYSRITQPLESSIHPGSIGMPQHTVTVHCYLNGLYSTLDYSLIYSWFIYPFLQQGGNYMYHLLQH